MPLKKEEINHVQDIDFCSVKIVMLNILKAGLNMREFMVVLVTRLD